MIMRSFIKIFIVPLLAALALSSCASSSANLKSKAEEHYNKGTVYYEKGQYEKADAEFRQSQKLIEATKPIAAREKAKGEKLRRKIEAGEIDAKIEIADHTTNEETLDRRSEKRYRREYVVGVEDILYVFIWQNPDLTQEVAVRPDGRISFPLIQDVDAEGLTIPELTKAMKDKLKEYIKYPEISISIRKVGGKRVIVLGQVNYPGVYKLTGSETVLEAIALAQGFTNDSLASNTVVIKGSFTEHPRLIKCSSNMPFRGIMSQNLILDSGDIIFVPKKPISDLVWLTNEVNTVMSAVTGNISAIKPLVKWDN